MDVFHVNFIDFTSLGPIEGIEKITWVERYNQPGEFIIIGDPVPLATNLPLGRFISHSGTDDVMVVETHFIDESEDSEYPKKLQVKGTCITNYIMQNRVVHRRAPYDEEETFWSYSGYADFAVKAAYYETGPSTISVVNLLVQLLNNHLTEASGLNENIENLINMSYVDSDILFGNYVTDKLPYLNKAVYKILLESDIGLKAVRPGPDRAYLEDPDFIASFYSGSWDPKEMIFFVVHGGNDLSDSVIFDINNGDVHNARYLWTNKHDKNAVYSGNEEYVQRDFGEDLGTLGGWSRKVARVDLQDYDPLEVGEGYETLILIALNERGREAIRLAQSQGIIIDALGTTNSGPKYGIHYRLGDIVKVFGNYGINQNMRVSEVAFTQDKDKEFIIPTFKPVYIVPPPSPM